MEEEAEAIQSNTDTSHIHYVCWRSSHNMGEFNLCGLTKLTTTRSKPEKVFVAQ